MITLGFLLMALAIAVPVVIIYFIFTSKGFLGDLLNIIFFILRIVLCVGGIGLVIAIIVSMIVV